MAARKAKAKKSRKSQPATDGLLVHGGAAALIGTVGLVIAFALVWWQIIAQPQQAARSLEQAQLLDEYSQFFNGRIAELRETVGAMATSQSVIAAMVSHSDAQQEDMEQLLADQHPHIARVDIIQKGTAEVDLNAEVPISFGALDLIRRAETKEFVGPEVSLNQGARIYAAQPITPDGTVAGVLLVVFDNSYFLEPLRHFSRLRGKLEVLQTAGGAPSTPVMMAGGDAADLAAVEQQLIAPQWKLSFTASQFEVSQVDYTSGLFIPFLVSWFVLLGGLFLWIFHLYQKVGRRFTGAH